MLTRFRSRIHSLQFLSKSTLQLQSDKTANSVCLLSIILLLPYLIKEWSYILLQSVGLIYSLLVLPMVLLANYLYPISGMRGIALQIKEHWCCIKTGVVKFLLRVYRPLDNLERAMMQLQNLWTMINQMMFFILCDLVLVPGQRVTCLYTLMFYNVIAYCVSYIKELIEKEDWSPYVHITEHSNIKHLAMSATKIVLEWTKAVTFIITVVFMLLVFGLEQGLENYKPTLLYTIFTWTYYLITEKVFIELSLSFITYLQISYLDNLESLWVPVIMQVSTAIISLLFAIPVLLNSQYKCFLLGIYNNVYLRLKDTYYKSFNDLNTERNILKQYRYATRDELVKFDDVCAICLNPMKLARFTPCHHIFHGDCLRKCLKTSNQCPICKREFVFE
ncbi:RING finger protein 145-like isoform X1 [Cimex lectularius]|uniref:RING-type domain-containing protein n=2 Tax=Cimex lectularius TaxID=79782 RepID=A0A8I6TKL4_CIMLE|nr:RING finger protein 145-like isoform X1 [Cimex lectularius]XP_024083811.1 RING finger protein 145-like isoform X1 [Cimex lectularius]